MVRARPHLPAGHGEVLERPSFEEWPTLIESNRSAASSWEFQVCGLPALAVRELARVEAVERAAAFSARLGVEIREPDVADRPIVATGHQPELYHPGVWVKNFLLERLSLETGATAIDFVVDSDGFDAIEIVAPCMRPGVERCRQYLAIGTQDGAFATAAVPSPEAIDDFCRAGDEMLSTLPAPAVRRHFGDFCEGLRSAVPEASNVAELVTFARRRYEASANTGYLELPVTHLASSSAFSRFVAHIALDAERFVSAYNAELAEYRAATNTRSAAQPFPDLQHREGAWELPLWYLAEGVRRPIWAAPKPGGHVDLEVDGRAMGRLPMVPQEAALAVREMLGLVVPKAVTLTMFVRMFCSDLFIHGVGGGRYDRVTDGLIERYFGVPAPAYVVASMTMYLPLGAHVVSDEEIAEATELVNRFEHNPDQLLDMVEFDSPDERRAAMSLAAEKAQLLTGIRQPDADKKAIGTRIREVNAQLGAVLAPFGQELADDLERLKSEQQASEILVDRTYPFAYWSPSEVADKIG